jgi:hypothetical protein
MNKYEIIARMKLNCIDLHVYRVTIEESVLGCARITVVWWETLGRKVATQDQVITNQISMMPLDQLPTRSELKLVQRLTTPNKLEFLGLANII